MKRYFAKILLLLLLIVWVAPTVSAQSCFLWQVESPSSTVYLLGSVHLACADFYPLNEKIEQAFNQSEILVVEVNINQLDQRQVHEMMIAGGVYSEGDSLAAHISEDTYKLAESKLQRLGLDITQFTRHKPWFLAQEISTYQLQRLGLDPEYGIDNYFLERSEDKKQILELESFDFQIQLFDNFSDYYQDLFLFYTIKDIEMIKTEIQRMKHAWTTGEAGTLEAIVSESLLRHPELEPIYEKLIYERNRTMLAKIEQYLGTAKSYFIVIGAAHLVGAKGIIKLLKDKGYRLQQW